MFFKIFNNYDKFKKLPIAKAHCDIPCKIYDPMIAQVAVLTMIRTVDLLNELVDKNEQDLTNRAQFSRLVSQKEEHGIKVKDEIRVIWGDYFKEPQFSKYPEIHELTHNIMLTASKAKQTVDKKTTLDLLDYVNRFAEIFWSTKDIKTYRAKCPYPPSLEVIYPDLKS
tara:strand:- start:192 stop:695 length:504 start_codon:yes stop_codon:yes gene_type:complete